MLKPNPNVLVFGGVAFGIQLGCEGRTLKNRINALIRGNRGDNISLYHVKIQQGGVPLQTRRGPSPRIKSVGTLILDSQPSECEE